MNISNFLINRNVNAKNIFENCFSLGELDLSHFLNENVEFLKELFNLRHTLKKIICSEEIRLQILFEFPDYINKCVPFEIRTIKGFLYFFIPLIICYISMAYLLAGEKIFYTLNITLTPAQIIRNIIIISSGLTMGFLFYRQAKQMNKKE